MQNVEHKFAQVAEDRRFRFFGNVNIVGSKSMPSSEAIQSQMGSSYTYPLATKVSISSLLPHYTHILFSYGSSMPRPLGIPGSRPGELYNVHPALDFVNWYNGHPAAHDEDYLASQPWKRIDLTKLRHATIVGAGNVALDVARILLRSSSTLKSLFQKSEHVKSRTELRETDIPEAILDQLSKSDIEHVDIVARRGPAQVAFTNKELREMMDLQGVSYQGLNKNHGDIARNQIGAMEQALREGHKDPAMSSDTRVRKRLMSILEKGSIESQSSVQWSTSFFQSPRQFIGAASGDRNICKAIEWDEMTFRGLPSSSETEQPWSASAAASSSGHQLSKTGKQLKTDTDLIITSVGYQGSPLDSADPIQTNIGLIPWDAKRGIIPNSGGRVLSNEGKKVSQLYFHLVYSSSLLAFFDQIAGLYVSGWLASGPVGVIASTRIDSNSVADQLVHDWQQSPESNSLTTTPRSEDLEELRQSSLPVVSWSDWLRLDVEEVRRGKDLGKLREKVLCEWSDVSHYLDFSADDILSVY